jgi:NAD-dependent deacetylase
MSTESGIPDFRSAKGLWQQGMQLEELVSIDYFRADPEAFWHSFKQLFHTKLLGNYQPNAGHQFLAWLEEAGKQVSILTQNIDGLHGVAGSRHVSELHGTLRTASCPSCGRRRGWNTSITMCCRCVPTAWMCSSRTWCCMASRYR